MQLVVNDLQFSMCRTVLDGRDREIKHTVKEFTFRKLCVIEQHVILEDRCMNLPFKLIQGTNAC